MSPPLPVPPWSPGRHGRRPDLSVIVHGRLIVGEYPTPDDVPWLRAVHGVTAIVCLQDHADLAGKGLRAVDLRAACRRHGIEWHHFPVPDGDAEALRHRLCGLLPLLAHLGAGGACVYLHCNLGFNRAPTVAIAHLHVNAGLTRAEARRLVVTRRACAPLDGVV